MASNKTANWGTLPLLKPGWWVALTLKPDTAPRRCYFGEIQPVDDSGITITCDWPPITPPPVPAPEVNYDDTADPLAAHRPDAEPLVGPPSVKFDLYLPRESIQSALVATDEHDKNLFAAHAKQWRTDMNK